MWLYEARAQGRPCGVLYNIARYRRRARIWLGVSRASLGECVVSQGGGSRGILCPRCGYMVSVAVLSMICGCGVQSILDEGIGMGVGASKMVIF
jgi:hypothetical protein